MRARRIAIAGSIAALSFAAVPVAQAASTRHLKAVESRVDRSRDANGVRHVDRSRDGRVIWAAATARATCAPSNDPDPRRRVGPRACPPDRGSGSMTRTIER
jgi:hypothetical protein